MWMPMLWLSPCHSNCVLISSWPYVVLLVLDNDTRFVNFRSSWVGWAGRWTCICFFIWACLCSITSRWGNWIATNWYGSARAFVRSWFGLWTTMSFQVGYMSCLQMVRARMMQTSTSFATPARLGWVSGTLLAMLGLCTPSMHPLLRPVSSMMKPLLLYPWSTGQYIISWYVLVHDWLYTPTMPIPLICSTACATSPYITPSSSLSLSCCSSLTSHFASSTSQEKTTL